MRDLTLAYEPLDALLQCRRPDNPKLHDLDALTQSIDRAGYVTPVVVNEADDSILEGHGRLETLQRLQRQGAPPPAGIHADADGRWLVPVVRGASLSATDARAFVVAANRITEEGGWDDAKLAAILRELEESGAGLAGTGFSAADLDDLLDELGMAGPQAVSDVDSAPDLPPARELWVQPDAVYALGHHRLLIGDARDLSVFERLMHGELADVLWTDPPYGVAYRGGTKRRLTLSNDDASALDALLPPAFANCDAVLRPGSALYIAHPSGRQSLTFLQAFAATGWELRQTLIWLKDALVPGHGDYHFRHEPILYGCKPGPGRFGRGARRWFGDNAASTVFEFPRPRSSKAHPTMKPVGLVAAMLRNSSRSGEIVLDPFVGSGSTLLAAEQLGRRCFALEVDPAYAQVAIERWQRLTGHRAELVGGAA